MLHTPATPAAAVAPLRINREAAAPAGVNPAELDQLLTAHSRAYRPGLCHRFVLASIVAAGSIAGIDYSQERDYAEPLLLSGAPLTIA